MNLASVLLGIWLILLGLVWAGVVTISTTFLGWWAFVTGVLWLVEFYHPITIPVRRTPQA